MSNAKSLDENDSRRKKESWWMRLQSPGGLNLGEADDVSLTDFLSSLGPKKIEIASDVILSF